MDESPGKMYALGSVMLAVAIIAVALRFHVRLTHKQALQADDWLIVPALVGVLGTTAAMFDATVRGGLGEHTQLTPDGSPIFTEAASVYLQDNYATLLTQMLSFGCTKLSVLFFFRRFFRGKTAFNIASWIMIGVVCVWTVAFFFAHMLQCLPIPANWEGPAAIGATCVNELQMYIAETWSDAITDAIILSLPMPIIWNLKLSMERKLALSGVFLLGALTVLSSIARLVVYYHIEAQLNANDPDLTWIIAPTFYWPVIESSLGILGACLPALRPMFKGRSAETMVRSMRGVLSGGSEPRASLPPPETTKHELPASANFTPSVARSGRSNEKDTWSYHTYHSDTESFGYHAEVSAQGVSPERTYDMV